MIEKPILFLLLDDEAVEAQNLSTNNSRRNSRSKSPSIEDLERRHRKLADELAELSDEPQSKRRRLNSGGENGNGGASSNVIHEVIDLGSPDSPPASPDVEAIIQSPKRIPLNDSVDESSDLGQTPKHIPLNDSVDESAASTSYSPARVPVSQSLAVDSGTPVHDAFLKGSKPHLDSFASGITPFSPKEESPVKGGRGYMILKKLMGRKKK